MPSVFATTSPARVSRVIGAVAVAFLAALAVLLPAPALAADAPERSEVELSAPVTPFVFDGDLRDLPPPPVWRPGDPIKEIPRRFYLAPGTVLPAAAEPRVDALALQQQQQTPVQRGAETFTTPNRNFPGHGFTGVAPPDTVGDVGPDHYIQSVNAGGGAVIDIWNKDEPTPTMMASFTLDSLGSGACANGFGDPIVLYDRLADRWVLTEFSGSGNHLCVHVSQSGDPISGGWFSYDFTTPTFPDYPKYGIWPTDANGGEGSYIVTANDGGPGIYALNRGAMLAGLPSSFQKRTVSNLPGFGFETLTPADIEGPTGPASGEPAIVMRHRDTEAHSGPSAPGDLLEMWYFHVDWVNTANTTITPAPSIDVADFDSGLCGLTSFSCFPQPGTGVQLDPLREVIMNRLQYMHRGDYETLFGNYVTDVSGANLGGVRWFELRRESGGGWELFQEGTYSLDNVNRWMGASAMDSSGNVALAYNVSSGTTFPGLRYTGRLASDPLDVMTQPETVLHAGTASSSTNRYGDYASMDLDPSDDCTFWFTGEDNTAPSWRTQIASFRFDACGCEIFPDPPLIAVQTGGDNEIDVDWNDSALASVSEYRIYRSFAAGGPYSQIATIADSSPGAAGGPGYSYTDTDVSGGITYHYQVRSSDGGACTSGLSNEAHGTATGVCTLPPLFDGLASVTAPFLETCTLQLAWDAADTRCGGPAEYTVYRSTSPGFTPGPANLLVTGLSDTGLTDVDGLVSGTTYYYVVRATDLGNGISESNVVVVGGSPQGAGAAAAWSDDAGDTGGTWMILEAPWAVVPHEGTHESAAYHLDGATTGVYVGLRTPVLRLGERSALSFSTRFDIEDGFDKGEVQISTDHGTTWQRVDLDYPGSSSTSADAGALPPGTYFTGRHADYATWVADLSPYANRDVVLRFASSSDAFVGGAGWWIDDIRVSDVAGGGICATGSACADNPFVSVDPDGPLTVCAGEDVELSVDLTGGTGPFEYQWLEDGIEIPGATGPTLVVSDTTSHNYNCEVRAPSCPDRIKDATGVDIARVAAPSFGGVVSVDNAFGSSCSLQLGWNPATSLCPGPIHYSVYRSTTLPVSPNPANRVASGLVGTSYVDSIGLVDGTTYHYLVRATDRSNDVEESNGVVRSDAPSGTATGSLTLLAETFEDVASWNTWTVATGPGPHTCSTSWARVNIADQRPAGGSGRYALIDSERCGAGTQSSASLTSRSLDATAAGGYAVTLDFDIYYRHRNGDNSTVEVWDGAAWRVVWADTNSDINGHLSIDISQYALGNPDLRVRFNYQNAAFDYWFAVDDVEVVVDTVSTCSSLSGPPAVPDGTAGSTPLSAARLDTTGSSIEVGWDVGSCVSPAYNLIYGDLASVGAYAPSGSRCSIGTAGTYVWSGVPAGDLYFLVVGASGAGVESSWGLDGGHQERNGATASGQCGVTLKDPRFHCP